MLCTGARPEQSCCQSLVSFSWTTTFRHLQLLNGTHEMSARCQKSHRVVKFWPDFYSTALGCYFLTSRRCCDLTTYLYCAGIKLRQLISTALLLYRVVYIWQSRPTFGGPCARLCSVADDELQMSIFFWMLFWGASSSTSPRLPHSMRLVSPLSGSDASRFPATYILSAYWLFSVMATDLIDQPRA